MFKRLMSKYVLSLPGFPVLATAFPSTLGPLSVEGFGVKSLKKLGLSLLNTDSVMDHFVYFCGHLRTMFVAIPVSPRTSQTRLGQSMQLTHGRGLELFACTLPALIKEGLACCSGIRTPPDHSRADRTPPPAIYGAFLPSLVALPLADLAVDDAPPAGPKDHPLPLITEEGQFQVKPYPW